MKVRATVATSFEHTRRVQAPAAAASFADAGRQHAVLPATHVLRRCRKSFPGTLLPTSCVQR